MCIYLLTNTEKKQPNFLSMSDAVNDDEWKWNNDGVSNHRELATVTIQIPFIFVVIFVIIIVWCCCCRQKQGGGEGHTAQAGQRIGTSASNTVSTGKPKAVAVPMGGENGIAAGGQGGGVVSSGGREAGGLDRQNDDSSAEC